MSVLGPHRTHPSPGAPGFLVWALAAALLIGFAAAPLRAQDPAPAADQAPDAPDAADRAMGFQLEELTRQILSAQTGEEDARLGIASTLLAHATELAPDDAELWRLRLEAADLTGDSATLVESLKGYLRNRPDDDAAQLRLIDLLITRRDTVDARLEAYDKLLHGSNAGRLSRPLRSRIATRAAALALETGDDAKYKELLKEAVALDRANRGAMSEIYRILQEKADASTPYDRAQAMMLLHGSDPTNVEIRRKIGVMLTHCGHYDAALDWFASAHALNEQSRLGPPPPGDFGDWTLALWATGQARNASSLLESYRAVIKAQADAQAQAQGAQPPETVALPPRLSSVLAMVQRTLGDSEASDKAFGELASVLRSQARDNPDDPDALANLIWAHLMFDREAEGAEPMIGRLAELNGDDDPRVQRLRGWLALRKGEPDKAREILTPLEADDRLASMGLAMLPAEGAEQGQQQIDRLRAVFEEAPGTVVGVMAANKLRELGARAQSSEECVRIARLVAQVPDSLRDLGLDPRSPALRISAKPQRILVEYGEPVAITLTLENASRVPLSIGANGSAPSTAFFVPKVAIGQREPNVLPPIVIDLGRRLVLEPGERVEVTTRLSGVPLSALLQSQPDLPLSISGIAILNPQMVEGGMIPGPLGATAPMRATTSGGRELTPDAVDARFTALSDRDRAASMKAAAWLVRVAAMYARAEDEQAQEAASRIARAVEIAYAKMDPVQQAYVVGYLPADDKSRELFGPIIDSAVKSTEPLVQYVLLLTMVDKSDSTILMAGMRQADSPVGPFAKNLQAIWLASEKAAAEREAAGDDAPEGPAPFPGIDPQK